MKSIDLQLLAIGFALLSASCGTADASVPTTTHLELFRQLDFEAFNKQNWPLFRALHCADVVVTSSDGSRTDGIDAHVAFVQAAFTSAPDTNIVEHPVETESADVTAVTGIYHATFSQPMMLPDGSIVPPTGKTLEAPMATVARWRGNCISEEQLFMPDSKVQAAQLGLSP